MRRISRVNAQMKIVTMVRQGGIEKLEQSETDKILSQ